MRKVLVAWIGKTDLRAPAESESVGQGPIAQALTSREFDEAFLLSDYDDKLVQPYLKWLKGRTSTRVGILPSKLSGPTNFGEIYEAAVRGVEHALGKARDAQLSFHLSPGTPAMAAVWIILGKTRFPAELVESSREQGVRTASVPFDLSAEFLPDLLREQDERLKQTATGTPPEAPEFADILHKSRVMSRLIERARRVAIRSVPVLIEGESGTGKELLARAIHRASPRRDKTFIAVNCGAIPAELVESELFGHEKGSFTGAHSQRKGHFEEAHGGTLFLDELGELPGPVQVKLLRAIQEGEVVRLGASKPTKVDVRIVAATNRTLTEEISLGRFREDLFYRLAVAVLKLPPLRERQGDVGMLIDHLFAQVNREAEKEPGFKEKKLSAGARNLLLSHPWPGNVRELGNTLRRAAIWSDGVAISSEDVREALLPVASTTRPEVLGRPLGGGFNLRDLLKEVARHYLQRAMDEAQGNKTKATELVGLPSYQTLTNWLKTYEVQG
ncbi:sigma-54-dependent Fis family transcriptional regulator [Corallococcus sp. AB038B]|uniref:sigma-54 interaction domain-containing protein n=1 Tax=Corallococcus sp. AB038B TaxID=2316718 RepID=UPI000ECFD7F1|nr:sigma-54 dependent transcriptional regulator [Corallococcus sp. AB038B]RKI05077.1 sigma-54-dependent Fis family transcriptional regulator [Corallococcus sp. AB038B]